MKEKKTEQELRAMIMARLREHPEWSDVVDVAITRRSQYQPNWDAAFVMNGQMATPAGAFRIATELGNQYDLA